MLENNKTPRKKRKKPGKIYFNAAPAVVTRKSHFGIVDITIDLYEGGVMDDVMMAIENDFN